MKIKKMILSLLAMLLTLSLSPKFYAEVESVDSFEATIRRGGYFREVYKLFFEKCKLRELEKIYDQFKCWKGNNVYELKDIIREIAYPESGRMRECYGPEIMGFLRSIGQDGTYGSPVELELRYIALVSGTVEELLSNLKNMKEAYQRVCNKPDRWPLY